MPSEGTAGGRERLPYRFNAVVQALREQTRETDAQLEAVITDVAISLEDDGVIDEHEAKRILLNAIRAFRGNVNTLNCLNLLDESGSEAALREVERVQAKTRKLGRHGRAD